MHALLLKHKVKPGRRDDVEAIWRRHMQPAIAANEGHVSYIYSFGSDPDTIAAFQVYRSRAAAEAFLKTAAYQSYLAESRELLEHDPEVVELAPRWIKPA